MNCTLENGASSHDGNLIESVLKHSNFKKANIGNSRVESYKTIEWQKLDVTKAIFEEKILRKVLLDQAIMSVIQIGGFQMSNVPNLSETNLTRQFDSQNL